MQQEINFYALMKRRRWWDDWLEPERLWRIWLVWLGFLLLIFLKDVFQVYSSSQRLQADSRKLQDAKLYLDDIVIKASGVDMKEALEKLAPTTGKGGLLFPASHSMPAVLETLAGIEIPGVWLTGFHLSNSGKDILLSGATINPASAQAYLEQLKQQSAFRNVSFQLGEIRRAESASKPGQAWMVFQIAGKVEHR